MKYFFLYVIVLMITVEAIAQQYDYNPRQLQPLFLKTGRTVSFVTDEGSYMNLDLSPIARGYLNRKYGMDADKDPKLTLFMDKVKIDGFTAWPEEKTRDSSFLYSSRIFTRIRNAGRKVTMGSHGNDMGIGPHNEIWALQLGGLTNLQALQAATILAAEALGVQKDLGSIEAGKIADLIILAKNPLDDIHNSKEILYVMKDGVLYDGNTLDTLWPFQKKCPDWKLEP